MKENEELLKALRMVHDHFLDHRFDLISRLQGENAKEVQDLYLKNGTVLEMLHAAINKLEKQNAE